MKYDEKHCILFSSAVFKCCPWSVISLQVFPDVTILFSDVVKFNEICIHITPMQVVDMLNEIYIVFDTLSEKHNVYKVT